MTVFFEHDEVSPGPSEPTEFTPLVFTAPYRLAFHSETGIPIGRLEVSRTRQRVELSRDFVPPCQSNRACDTLERLIDCLVSLGESLAADCFKARFLEDESRKIRFAEFVHSGWRQVKFELCDARNRPARSLAAVDAFITEVRDAHAVIIGETSVRDADVSLANHLGEAFTGAIRSFEQVSVIVADFLGRSSIPPGQIDLEGRSITPGEAWQRVCLQLGKPLGHFVERWHGHSIQIRGRADGFEHVSVCPVDPVLPVSEIKRRPVPERAGRTFTLTYQTQAADLTSRSIVFYLPLFVQLANESLTANVVS
ncbi:hypothetical protein LBMAG52_05200 [Planctomycetia bacterium]|nr:hypothetical protein LBMAG52_05200 [Planctomycetia bacterium]